MKSSWLNSVLPIAAIFSFRMLGLFMLIPIFTLYAHELRSSSPALIGIALGAYGLSQGILQIPFGLLSDKYGRKPMIAIGLLLFIFGSLLGALTHSIYGIILARILQGMGAIGSVLIALLADLTPEEHRTKAMAVIGSVIGISFAFAMVLSPTLAQCYGLSGIFYVTAAMAFTGIMILFFIIPSPPRLKVTRSENNTNLNLFKQVIQNKELMRLNFGIFCQHFILTATFFILPQLIRDQIQQGNLSYQWQFYLINMFFSFVIMIPFIFLAEKKHRVNDVFIFSIMLTVIGQSLLALTYHSWLGICGCVFIYFVTFNILEATLPSLISKKAPRESKGTAMGIYSTFQFLGIFAGGSSAGIIFPLTNAASIFIMNGFIAILWLLVSTKMHIKLPTQSYKYPL